MQKSIFTRYLAITMAIVVLSFIMLGSVMMVFFSQYWRDEKKELLTKNANSIADMSSVFLTKTGEDTYELQTTVLKGFIDTFSNSIDADIFITDLEGNILLGNYSNSKLTSPKAVPKQTVAQAAQGLYENRNTFGGLYQGPFYIIGVPMYADGGEKCVGAVFATTSAATVGAFQGEAIQMFLVAAAAALGVTFCVVGAFAYRLVKPLRQMSAAARSFGGGDFSVRVPVTSGDELGQLAISFNNMANSLSNSEGTRRSFIANVSHELKTPMTTIAGFIDGILDGTIPREQADKYLHIVSDEVKRLSRLVKSMLDLSRIDSGEMKLHPSHFDITHTVVTTLLTFEQSIDEKKIEIRGLEEAQPQMVWGDQDLLHQVVYNLIENAVKFTNSLGYISVLVTDSIDRTTVTIENSGQGIAPEELPMIFERFYKTDKSRSRDKNGMGLGLYIVRTILKLHGGDISVSSVVGQYCRFEFYIPKPQEAPKLKDTGSFKLKDTGSFKTKDISFRSKSKKTDEPEAERSTEDDGRSEE
jgi:signal transduction histidine kinase